jgi:hypothetical protein
MASPVPQPVCVPLCVCVCICVCVCVYVCVCVLPENFVTVCRWVNYALIRSVPGEKPAPRFRQTSPK